MNRNRRVTLLKWGISISGLALAWLPQGCSSEFSGCDSAECEPGGAGGNTSGSGGSSPGTGEGGAGGEADGLPPLPESCEVDADCDDGKACTGTEVCVAGECEYGTSPCDGVVPKHCGLVCIEGTSGPECEITGADADGDGHDAALCEPFPGDDCNDTPGEGEDVYPGAPELCDELDNDCDGIAETEDEVKLPGKAIVLAAPVGTTVRDEPAIAASPDGFGVVWSDFRHEGPGPIGPITSEIYYRSLAADGSLGDELRVTTSTDYNEHRSPHLTWGVDRFGVAWVQVEIESDDTSVTFARVVADGSQLTHHGILSTSDPFERTRVVWYNDEDAEEYAVFWVTGSGGLLKRHVSWLGEIGGSATTVGLVPEADYDAGSLSDGRIYRVALYGEDPSLRIYASAGETSPNLQTLGAYSKLAAGGDYFAHWDETIESGRVEKVSGKNCRADIPGAVPAAIATVNELTVLLAWDVDQTALRLYTVHTPSEVLQTETTCALGPSALLAQSDETTTIASADLAIDAEGNVGVVWSSKNEETGEWSIMSRVFSTALCE